jgi:serine/threonine-protein kinase
VTERDQDATQPQQIARRYVVVEKLGAGAFGTVYKAKDRILGRMVAIKTIRLEGLAAADVSVEELLQRFHREAQVSAQLRHPNIVTIYDVGAFEGMSYLAMEFIEGTGLDKIIKSEHRLSVERAASIAAQVADALAFAHQHDIVHRDVKPANIMVETSDRVKVTDFGIAKITTASESLTATGSLLGTPSYMSPEQARGQSLDGRSDLFALGSVLYEMVTGKKAFQGESITGLIFKIITEEPEPIDSVDPRVPEAIANLIQKALQKDPAARFQSGREMAQALLAFTQPAATPTIRMSELPTRRDMTAVSSAVDPTRATRAPGPAADADEAAASRPSRQAAPPHARPTASPIASPRPRPRSSLGLWLGLALAGVVLLGIGAAVAFWTLQRLSPEPETLSTSSETVASPADEAGPPVAAETVPGGESSERQLAGPTPVSSTASTTTATDGDASEEAPPRAQPAHDGPSQEPRSPRRLRPRERPAVATLHYLMKAQDAFHQRHGHYGSLEELQRDRLVSDVPLRGNRFTRRGYRFELTLDGDGYELRATPVRPGSRSFVGSEAGVIRPGAD